MPEYAAIGISYVGQQLLDVIAYPVSTQRDVASAYAWAIQRDGPDASWWGIANEAIIERWSASGLRRVKKMAWDGTYA